MGDPKPLIALTVNILVFIYRMAVSESFRQAVRVMTR